MTDPKKKEYNSKEYRAARAELLRDHPLCHWCRKAPATQADHLIETDKGGTWRDGLVPSCGPCNARRGANYENTERARRTRAREQASQVFGSTTQQTPTPQTRSLSKGRDSDRSGDMETDSPLFGRKDPRLVSASQSSETFGPLVAEWSERFLGKTLMDWQRLVLDGQLEHHEGQLCHTESLVSCARQQGKSVGLLALAGFWMTEMPKLRNDPQSVMLVANKLDRSSAMFRQLAPILEKLGGKPFWSYGREQLIMPDGSTLRVVAATGSQHGASNDLVLLDELWQISPTVVFDALRPTMLARPSPLMSMWSTAGDESSTVMLQLREQAINAIDAERTSRLYFAEWSAPAGRWDREWWPWANPALGQTVRIEALEAAAESPDRAAFLRAHLNQWVASSSSWLPIDSWEKQQTADPMPAGGVLAVDSSVDTSRYVGIRAASRPDNRVQVTVEFVVETEDAMWAEIERVLEDTDVQFAVTPTLDIHTPEKYRRRTTTVGYGELLKFTSLVRSMILEGKLLHPGQLQLTEHVSRAVLGKTSGTVVLSSQKSPGPIELCRTLVWSAALASKKNPARRAAIGIAR